MRVAVYHGSGRPLVIEEVEEPQPAADEVLVEIARCSICGSDTSLTGGGPFDFKPGRRMGHEFSGTVIEVGSAVSDLAVGDRVMGLSSGACGACAACRRDDRMACESPRVPQGGFGERVVLPVGQTFRLPDTATLADGALVEPLAAGLHGMRMAGITGGEHVVIVGAGSMGLASVFWARRMGAGRIDVVARTASRAEVVEEFGGDALHATGDDLGSAPDLLPLADVVVEAVGRPGVLQVCGDLVRPRGTVASLGMCGGDDPLVPVRWSFKEARLIFPLAFVVSEVAETVAALADAHVHPERMVSEVIGLDALPDRLEQIRTRGSGGKVQVDPHQ